MCVHADRLGVHVHVHPYWHDPIDRRRQQQVTLVEGDSKDVLEAITLRVFDQEKALAFYNKLGALHAEFCVALCLVCVFTGP